MTGKDTDVLPQPRSEQVPSRPRSPVVLPAVMAAEGVAFAVLAGLDGSPAWRVARVLVVVAVTALAVWFTRRAGRVGQGTAALLLGIAGTVTGAGVASAHLAKAGLDAAAVLAAIVLVTGLVLLGWGAVALVRAMPGWWRLLAVPAALALLQFVLLPLTVGGHATNRPPGPLGTGTPAQLRARLPGRGVPHRRRGAAVGLVHPGAQRRRRGAAARLRVHPHRGARPGRGAGPARLRGAAGRCPRPRPLRRACDGLRLVGRPGPRRGGVVPGPAARRPGRARSPCSASPWAASRPWPRPGPTRGSAPWSPRASRASSTPTTAGSRTTSPGPSTAAWNGCSTPRPGCSAAPPGR